MLKNTSFAFIALFWVAMNALLWHSEMGAGHELASRVPVKMVWEKILTSPDDSTLSILQSGKRIGSIRWRPEVGEESAKGKVLSENEPEGIVRKLTEYHLEIEMSFVLETLGRAVRSNSDIRFDPDLRWKRFDSEWGMRPAVWRVKGNVETADLWLESREGDTEWIRRFTFEDLRHPQKLLAELESPLVAALLAQNTLQAGQLDLSLNWTAQNEWLQIGRSRVRVYRLKARLFDRHEIHILVSRVGELLKAEFPGNLKLINETLFTQ